MPFPDVILKSGARRATISEKGKILPQTIENTKSILQKQASGWYDALTTWPPYHPYLDIQLI